MSEEIKPDEELVTIGKSWEDLEAELGQEPEPEEETILPKPTSKNFWLNKKEIAEFAYDASFNFRLLVEDFEQAGEDIQLFASLTDAEQDEWAEIAGMALRMQDEKPEAWARIVHAKNSMGLLKDGVLFDEKFIEADKHGNKSSPLVAPWECQPHQRRIPLLIFKAVCSQLHSVWDKENELLTR